MFQDDMHEYYTNTARHWHPPSERYQTFKPDLGLWEIAGIHRLSDIQGQIVC